MPTRSRRRGVATLLASLAAALTLTIAVAAPASAGHDSHGQAAVRPNYTCAQLGYTNPTRYRLDRDGASANVGHLLVYYSRSKESNCLTLINTSGRVQNMYVGGWSPHGGGFDQGAFGTFAGSVVLRNTKGDCIGFAASIGTYRLEREGVHCDR